MRARTSQRGITLIDVVISSALLLLIFVGVAAAFQLTIDIVLNNKARAGAIALAGERLEFIRSLSYAQVGTSGGIPSGSLEQSESIVLNGTTFTRRTYVEYADDPLDGLAGADTNSIVADYKSVKVEVSWSVRENVREITLVSRFSPPAGLETAVSGGTLTISVVNRSAQALSNAEVTITNSSVSPAVNLITYTNASGTVSLIGAPAGTGYAISVTKPGYSTSQTYAATAQNTDPNPAHLTVVNNQTTTGTFVIDVPGSKTVYTYGSQSAGTWTDSFSDESLMGTSTRVEASGNKARFAGNQPWAGPAELRSVIIAPSGVSSWGSFSWDDTQPSDTTITYSVYYWNGTVATLIPDSVLPGNSAGFTSTVSLANVPVATYPSLILGAHMVPLTPTAPSPSVEDWTLTYFSAPPISATVRLRSATTIGSGPSGTVYKYDQTHTTNGSGAFTVSSIEPDAYTFSSDSSTGYDISTACDPQPETLSSGASMTTRLYLAPYTTNSLLIDVRASSTGALIPSAEVGLSRASYAASSTSNGCGQVFFSGLTQNNNYNITVIAPGYQTTIINGVDVNGTSRRSVTLP